MAEKRPLDPEAARSLRRDLKAALTDFAAGKGGLLQMLNQIERIVKYLCNDPDMTLWKARNCVTKFIEEHACEKIEHTGLPGIDWCRLYCYVTKHRNDIAHTGTEAALAKARTAALTTILLDALLKAGRKEGHPLKISEVMVTNPMCAEKWQTLADIRRTLLVNDFSVLPLRDGECGDEWQVVRAEELAAYLLVEDKECKKKRNKETLGCAVGKQRGAEGLKLHYIKIVGEGDLVKQLTEDGSAPSARIVINKDKYIVGLVTAFDLL